MDSTLNNPAETLPNVDSPIPRHELLDITIKRYRKRFDDLLVWINDVEKKAAALIAVNGVVLALSATLINTLSTIRQNIVDESLIILSPGSMYFFISVLIYILQLILFIVSMLLAYRGYKVSTYTVPNISYLYDESFKDENSMSKTEIFEQELAELNNSKCVLDDLLKDKASFVEASQRFFIFGCIILAVLFIFILITPYSGF